jgi:SSS family solute:Na+ symporter
MAGALLTIPISTVLKFLPNWTNGAFPNLPFLNRMEIDFVLIVLTMIIISKVKPKKATDTHTIEVDTTMFKVPMSFRDRIRDRLRNAGGAVYGFLVSR